MTWVMADVTIWRVNAGSGTGSVNFTDCLEKSLRLWGDDPSISELPVSSISGDNSILG